MNNKPGPKPFAHLRTEKRCPRCRRVLPLDSFHKNKRHADGHTNVCKKCANKNARAWHSQNREKALAAGRDVRRRRTRAQREAFNLYQRCWLYKITREELAAITEAYGGRCGICEKKGKRLGLDHNHETGQVRGLVCVSCNWKIAVVESPTLLARIQTHLAMELPEQKSIVMKGRAV